MEYEFGQGNIEVLLALRLLVVAVERERVAGVSDQVEVAVVLVRVGLVRAVVSVVGDAVSETPRQGISAA